MGRYPRIIHDLLTKHTPKDCYNTLHNIRHLSVLEGHEVVEDGVDGGGDVVQDAGHVHQVLVNRSKELGALKRNIKAFYHDPQ